MRGLKNLAQPSEVRGPESGSRGVRGHGAGVGAGRRSRASGRAQHPARQVLTRSHGAAAVLGGGGAGIPLPESPNPRRPPGRRLAPPPWPPQRLDAKCRARSSWRSAPGLPGPRGSCAMPGCRQGNKHVAVPCAEHVTHVGQECSNGQAWPAGLCHTHPAHAVQLRVEPAVQFPNQEPASARS